MTKKKSTKPGLYGRFNKLRIHAYPRFRAEIRSFLWSFTFSDIFFAMEKADRAEPRKT